MSEKHQSDQGELFDTHYVGTDPQTADMHFEPNPNGVYHPADNLTPEDFPTAEISEAVKSDNRRKAQVGKHSPLERGGDYRSSLKPGDYLPGFGPVTYSNWEEAKSHASFLDTQKLGKLSEKQKQINQRGFALTREALKKAREKDK